jgi:hypothetical protein
MKTLYQTLKEAGIETDSHESDLYFPVTDASREILSRFPLQKSNATTFSNEAPPHVGERWYDVPFAYDPFWTHKQSLAAGCTTEPATVTP